MIVKFQDNLCGVVREINIESADIVQVYIANSNEDYAIYQIVIETKKARYIVGRYDNRNIAVSVSNDFFRALSGDDFYRALSGDYLVYNFGGEENEETTSSITN